ncbi:hypothetical protein [Sandaracinobacteroides saxicola]|uniref:Uncharacterized protein n=1 Tax=Sandaracinobacteroides saxicola TaxID=2759707 RepID=A0A7G5IHW8_9SPHN|nr:hypothetical protein [Sandaracinobacteroides saxicola]QMW22960.1 hypothetical protein H3309_00130 [Sandaracinobacteroides saxicola]
MKLLLALCSSFVFGISANAQAVSTDAASFCKESSKKSAKFNDGQGFSNIAIRQGTSIKVYREIASPELDWAIYDGYAFSSAGGTRVAFSRVIIYAGNPIVYARFVDANGKSTDNKNVLPEGFYVPSEPEIANFADFCKLPTKQKNG